MTIRKNTLLYIFSLIYLSTSLNIDITLITTLQNNISAIYDSIIQKNGTQVIISCKLSNGSNSIRKYLMAGNSFILQGQYQASLIDGYYDYLIVFNSTLISGSKNLGKMRFWNLTNYQYLFQSNTRIYATKIIYDTIYQRLIYVQKQTRTVKYFSTLYLAPYIQSISLNRTSDDLSISQTNGYLLLMIQTSTQFTNYIIKLSNLFEIAKVVSGKSGDRTSCWSISSQLIFMTTSQTNQLKIIQTTLQIFNLSTLINPITASGQSPIGGIGPISGPYFYSIFNYTVTGKLNTNLYLDTINTFFFPYTITTNKSTLAQPINYPLSTRLLQAANTYYFPFSYINWLFFIYQTQKSFFAVIADSSFYYCSFYGKCLTNQYFNTYLQMCMNCSSHCILCTPWVCITCQANYNLDTLTNLCVSTLTNATNASIIIGNLTNSTIILNTTNITVSNLTNNFNLTINQTILGNNSLFNNSYLSSSSTKTRSFLTFLRQLYFNFILRMLNKVPASRKVLEPFFKFFVNCDDLWLYYYHKRSYCNSSIEMFQSIQQFQNQKWQLIHSEQLLQTINFSEQDVKNYFKYMDDMSQKDNFQEKQAKNSGYLLNSLDFFSSNFWLILVTYFMFRLIFKLTINYHFSVFIRQYSFSIYLGIMMLEGNTQYFTYLLFSELQMLTNTRFLHKLSHIYVLSTYFTVFLFGGMCFIVIFFSYESKNLKFFFQNTKINTKGSIYLFATFFVKNVILGFVHSYFNYSYTVKICLLFGFELFFLYINTLMIVKKLINVCTSHWVIILCGFLRILIIASFYLDYVTKSVDQTFQIIQTILFCAYLIIGLFSLVHQTLSFCWQISTIIKKHYTSEHYKLNLKQQKQIKYRQAMLSSNFAMNQYETKKKIRIIRNKSVKALRILSQSVKTIQNSNQQQTHHGLQNIQKQQQQENQAIKKFKKSQKMKRKHLPLKRKIFVNQQQNRYQTAIFIFN